MSAPVNHDYDGRAGQLADLISYYSRSLLIVIGDNGAHLRSDFVPLLEKARADIKEAQDILDKRIAEETRFGRAA